MQLESDIKMIIIIILKNDFRGFYDFSAAVFGVRGGMSLWSKGSPLDPPLTETQLHHFSMMIKLLLCTTNLL